MKWYLILHYPIFSESGLHGSVWHVCDDLVGFDLRKKY